MNFFDQRKNIFRVLVLGLLIVGILYVILVSSIFGYKFNAEYVKPVMYFVGGLTISLLFVFFFPKSYSPWRKIMIFLAPVLLLVLLLSNTNTTNMLLDNRTFLTYIFPALLILISLLIIIAKQIFILFVKRKNNIITGANQNKNV